MTSIVGHSGVVDHTSDVLAFHPHWDVYLLIGFLAVGYYYGLPRLAVRFAPQGEPPVSRSQQWLFGAGLLAWVVVSTWPFHDIAEKSLFTFHMIEHMTLAWVVPPLLLMGSPWWLTRLLVKPILRPLTFLAKPLIALFIFNAVLAAIHIPRVVELMVTNDAFHFASHFVLMATAFLLWWPVLGPIPEIPRLSALASIGYLFANGLVPTVPASFLTFASDTVYPVYDGFPRLWGLDVITDQTIAGLVMKIGGGLLLWGVMITIYFRWWSEEQRFSPSRPEQATALR
jgi:putative membrane protein